jgi:hypothetical protein
MQRRVFRGVSPPLDSIRSVGHRGRREAVEETSVAKICLVVEFHIKEGAHGAFDKIIRDHAAGTLADEAGCERFDVLQPNG